MSTTKPPPPTPEWLASLYPKHGLRPCRHRYVAPADAEINEHRCCLIGIIAVHLMGSFDRVVQLKKGKPRHTCIEVVADYLRWSRPFVTGLEAGFDQFDGGKPPRIRWHVPIDPAAYKIGWDTARLATAADPTWTW